MGKDFGSVEDLVAHITLEGCWGESLGALTSARQYRTATDSQVKELFKTVAEEEFNHCVLSWRLAAWAIRTFGKGIEDHFVKTINQLSRATDAKPLLGASAEPADTPWLPLSALADLERFGILSLTTMDEIDRAHGPKLVHELLGASQLASAVNEGKAIVEVDFSSTVQSHCER